MRNANQHPGLRTIQHICLFVLIFVQLENFSLIWRRHHYRWRAANFDLCSALMAIEQSVFFSGPQLLWHGASVYNDNPQGPVTLTRIAEYLAVELSMGIADWGRLLTPDLEQDFGDSMKGKLYIQNCCTSKNHYRNSMCYRTYPGLLQNNCALSFYYYRFERKNYASFITASQYIFGNTFQPTPNCGGHFLRDPCCYWFKTITCRCYLINFRNSSKFGQSR